MSAHRYRNFINNLIIKLSDNKLEPNPVTVAICLILRNLQTIPEKIFGLIVKDRIYCGLIFLK